MCHARETPIFNPKFPIRSISFSQMKKYSAPEHDHFTVFAVPETIIFEILLPTAGLFSWAPRARSRAPHFHATTRPSHLSSLRSPEYFTLPWCSGVSGQPECQPDTSYILQSVPETCIFTLELPELAPESRIFMLELPELDPEPNVFRLELDSEPPILASLQNFGWVPPRKYGTLYM